VREWAPYVLVALGVAMFFGWQSSRSRSDPSALRQRVADGAVLVDVRSPGEFAAGHLDGARNIPVDQVAVRAREIGPPEQPVVVYCRSGARSAAAARTLKQLGFAQVDDLGAMSNW
jgi:phage shock protein E